MSDLLQGPAGLQSLFQTCDFVVSDDTADSLSDPLLAVSSQRLMVTVPSPSLGARGGELPPGPRVAGWGLPCLRAWGFAVARASTPSLQDSGWSQSAPVSERSPLSLRSPFFSPKRMTEGQPHTVALVPPRWAPRCLGPAPQPPPALIPPLHPHYYSL